jgi:LysM repeat protein
LTRGWRGQAKRYGAPVAFLAAVTIAVLLVRSGLQTGSSRDAATVSALTTTTPSSTTTTTTSSERPRFYRLRAGETLSDVAIRFDTTVDELLLLNPGIEPTSLEVGERIRVN